MAYRYDRRDSRNEYESRERRRSPAPSSSRGSPSPAPRDENELPAAFGRISAVEDSDIDVLQRMLKCFVNEPLGILTRVLNGERKIKLWTRNFQSVRGICTGYVVAFDRHWNLILSDVDEAYLFPKKAKTPFLGSVEEGHNMEELPLKVPRQKKERKDEDKENESKPNEESGKKKRKKRKKKKKTIPKSRHVAQLFIRGDSIVMLTILNDSSPKDSQE